MLDFVPLSLYSVRSSSFKVGEMSSLVNEELDAIHQGENMLAEHIRSTIMSDIKAGKFNDHELAGRLGRTRVGVEAMKTRRTWTLQYAISIAHKLGYSIGKLEVKSDG